MKTTALRLKHKNYLELNTIKQESNYLVVFKEDVLVKRSVKDDNEW